MAFDSTPLRVEVVSAGGAGGVCSAVGRVSGGGLILRSGSTAAVPTPRPAA